MVDIKFRSHCLIQQIKWYQLNVIVLKMLNRSKYKNIVPSTRVSEVSKGLTKSLEFTYTLKDSKTNP